MTREGILPHPWNVTPAEGIRLQKELASLIVRKWDRRAVKRVAGTDVHFPSRDSVRAAIVIFTFPELEIIDSGIYTGPCTFPYIPGLLSFREIPPLLRAMKKIRKSPDLVLCDGQGIAHPRGFGLASHFGLVSNIPTIGCAKSPLYGEFVMPGPRKGERTPIKDKRGNTIGTVLRTRDHTKPLYVSVGHLIDLRTSIRFALSSTTRFRIPEPLRAAHRLASGGRWNHSC